MNILIDPMKSEIQSRCDALSNDSSLDDVRDLAIAAKIIELAGGTLNRTVLSEQIQRVVNLSGASSEIENLIALTSALIKAPEPVDPLPIGILAPFVDQDINFTDANLREWLKTGYISTDLASYPDAVRSYIPGNTSQATAVPGSMSAVLYHSASDLWLCSSGGAIHSSPDRITWTNRGGASITEFIELPSGKVIGVAGGTTYYCSDDGINWINKSGQPIGMNRVVPTANGYWYGCNGSQTGWAKDASAITAVAAASGTTWQDIAYSPDLNRLVMVGTSICQTNDAFYAGTWTSRTIPVGAYSSVVWFPDAKMFIATASNGVWVTSPDGINWTYKETLPFTISELYYDKFTRTVFATGGGGVFAYTRDGILWTSVGAGTASGKMTSKFGEGILIGSGGRFAPYTAVVGVETTSRLSASVPYYVRIK